MVNSKRKNKFANRRSSTNAMNKIIALLLLLTFACCPSAFSQRAKEFRNLLRQFQNLSKFDHNYPLERVYLHLDNDAYTLGETMWMKAYVVRASSIQPTTLSRVLYVELLNASGEIMERKLLRIEDGQATGEFKLELPIQEGFYEVRAYTREMLNWGSDVCFSRVVPIFNKKAADNPDETSLEIIRPQSAADLTPNHPRPYTFNAGGHVNLSFFPEGGQRAEGVVQSFAVKATDNRGLPLAELSGRITDQDGTTLATFTTHGEGLASFSLPATAEEVFAEVHTPQGTQRFILPEPTKVPYAMHYSQADGPTVSVQATPHAKPQLLGLLVTCRQQPCFFDTLSVAGEIVEIELPPHALREGVNTIRLIGGDGQEYAQRMVFKKPQSRKAHIKVLQNEATYEPFSPVALEIYVTDDEGKPLETTLSLAVREQGSLIAGTETPGAAEALLLASEVKGYIEHPSLRFDTPADTALEQRLNLLLMAQGQSTNTYSELTGQDSLTMTQPIEERLMVDGTVLSTGKHLRPQAGMNVDLIMFARDGSSLRSSAVTDSLGRFAFASSVDYMGDWVAQFQTTTGGKPKWSRVALGRQFSPEPRPFDPRELEPRPLAPVEAPNKAPSRSETETSREAQLFAWRDTIPTLPSIKLGEAVVVQKTKYKGFKGGRYTYMGGEKAALRRANLYYNIERATEQIKDAGGDVGLIWELLSKIDKDFRYIESLEADERYTSLLNLLGDTPSISDGAVINPCFAFVYRGSPALVFVNNELLLQRLKGDSPLIYADEVKSIVIMEHQNQWEHFIPTSMQPLPAAVSSYSPIGIFLYSRPDYHYFREKRGVVKRTIHGFADPKTFRSPSYRGTDQPTEADQRRTLFWDPAVKTDKNGKATAVFFSNSKPAQQLSITIRGITKDGHFIDYDR